MSEVSTRVTATAQQLQDLRHHFLLKGWTHKATGRILFELLVHLTLATGGVVALLTFDSIVLRACGLMLLAGGSMGAGTNSHTSSHYATSDKRWVNELLTYFGFPFILGVSATYWWHQHIVVHHPTPNVIGVDDDADLAPWFARTRDEIDKTRGFRRFYHERLQWLALPFMLIFTGLNMQKRGWVHLIRRLRDPRRRTNKHWIDLGALLFHYTCMVLVPCLIFGPWRAITVYLLWVILMGYLMFAVLAPGHFPPEAVCRSEAQRTTDFFLLQTSATVNFHTGWIGSLMCSGLQYQIEHHLFPNISHVYYPKISVVVKKFCLESGLPYHSYPWDVVLWKCVSMLRKPPRIERTLLAATTNALH